MKLAIVSGGFDPVHVGHLECFEKAKSMADHLFVIVNDDKFLERKKGKAFMNWQERLTITQAFKPVTMALLSIDDDDTVCKTLEWINGIFKDRYDKIAFCNGGDRTIDAEKPEHKLCLDLGIEPVYGLGDKIQSSSWLTNPNLLGKRERPSGYQGHYDY